MGTRGEPRAGPSTNSMVANNTAAAAAATPALLPARQPLASPPPATHSPSPMSPSLQTSAVTVSSPSMPLAAGEHREGLATVDAVAVEHFHRPPPSRQSFPHALVVLLQNPTPKCKATTLWLGVGWHHVLEGYQTSGIAGKKSSAGRKYTFLPSFNFVSKPEAHPSALFSSNLKLLFVFNPMSH